MDPHEAIKPVQCCKSFPSAFPTSPSRPNTWRRLFRKIKSTRSPLTRTEAKNAPTWWKIQEKKLHSFASFRGVARTRQKPPPHTARPIENAKHYQEKGMFKRLPIKCRLPSLFSRKTFSYFSDCVVISGIRFHQHQRAKLLESFSQAHPHLASALVLVCGVRFFFVT